MQRIPELDKRSENELRERMLELAESYTPEWKPNPDEPDMGMTLIELFAQMHSGTVRRLNRTVEKNRVDFCRFMGTYLRSSETSAGYVKVGFSSEQVQENVILPEGTVLTAQMPEGEEENSGFTTLDDVCVTSAHIEKIIMTDGSADLISTVYNRADDGENPSFVLFGKKTENQNSHVVEIGCKSGLMHIIGEGIICLHIKQQKKEGEAYLAEYFELAYKNEELKIEYASENGWEPFSEVYSSKDALILKKNADKPEFFINEEDENPADKIRFTLKKIRPEASLASDGVYLSTQGRDIKPDVVITKYGVAEDEWFSPFGEVPVLFDALYIASDEVLSKAGAVVSMQISVSFPPPPETKAEKKPSGSWKMVMRKSDLHEEELIVSWISSVAWEYYNGKGWKSLQCHPELRKTFSPVDGKKTYSLEFRCPDDAVPVLVEAEEHRYIRARIVQIENMYRPNIVYHLPLTAHIFFRYECNEPIKADYVITENQMIRHTCDADSQFVFFSPMQQTEPTVYFGLSSPLNDGPYRILTVVDNKHSGRMPALRWEYMTDNGWKPLNIYDDTGQFERTGIMVIFENSGFRKTELFGYENYWIRAVDDAHIYRQSNTCQRPYIMRMDFNCTEVRNCWDMPPVYFNLPAAEPNFICHLPDRNIADVRVYVDELELHSSSEAEKMLRMGMADPEYDQYGMLQRLWVRWTAVEHFWFSEAEDRHYRIDKNEGLIFFGDGERGKIPCCGKGDHIRINYSIGGGKSGNILSGTEWGSRNALGLITEISNPLPFFGGNDMESLHSATERTASEFQNNGQCVTVADYENIALQTDRSILKVKCISGYNADGEREAGSVTLIIMLSDFSKESTGFEQICDKLRRVIDDCRPVSLSPESFYIIHPRYISISVNATIRVTDNSRIFRIKEQVQKRIEEFLHPITGNFDGKGWRIGEFPHQRQIENAVRSVSGVAYVENFVMRAFSIQNDHKKELDLNHLTGQAFSLAVSGTHEVRTERN